MSKTAGTTKTTSQTGLPQFQEPQIEKLFSEANKLYETGQPSFFPGSTVAPLAPEQLSAQTQTLGTAETVGQLMSGDASKAFSSALGAPDVATNPYVRNMAEAAIAPIFRQLTEEALPAVRSIYGATGGVGGTKQSLGEAQAVERATRAAGETSAGIYGNAYGQGLSAQGNALGLLPGFTSAAFQPAQATAAVGEQNQAQQQAMIDEAIKRWEYEQAVPWTALSQFGNLVTGGYGGRSTTEVEGTPADPVSQSIATILAGLGLGSEAIDIAKKIAGWFT